MRRHKTIQEIRIRKNRNGKKFSIMIWWSTRMAINNGNYLLIRMLYEYLPSGHISIKKIFQLKIALMLNDESEYVQRGCLVFFFSLCHSSILLCMISNAKKCTYFIAIRRLSCHFTCAIWLVSLWNITNNVLCHWIRCSGI